MYRYLAYWLVALHVWTKAAQYGTRIIEVTELEKQEEEEQILRQGPLILVPAISVVGHFELSYLVHNMEQATVLDARASRVKWPAQFMSHWYGILFTE